MALKDGQEFFLTTREIEGDEEGCSINYEGLNEDVVPGNTI